MSRLTARERQWAAAANGDMVAIDQIAAKPRKATKPRAPRDRREGRTQVKIVTYLRRHLPEGALVWHTPNYRRSENHGHYLRSLGQLAGLPDLFVLTPAPNAPRLFGLEVKDEKGALSEVQTYVHERLGALGVPCALVREPEGARVFLESMGVVFR